MDKQQQILNDIFRFERLDVTNNGHPLLCISVRDSSSLERVFWRIKYAFNLNMIVYLRIDGLDYGNYYFAVDPITKSCYSYCFGYFLTSKITEDNKYGFDVPYLRTLLNRKDFSLYDLFVHYYPLGTKWNVIASAIGTDLDWNEKIPDHLPTKLTSFYDKLCHLFSRKYRTK